MKNAMMLLVTLGLVLLVGFVAYSADTGHGKAVYTEQKCSMCHSIGDGKKAPLDGVGSKLKAEEIKKWIKTPKAMKADSKMKAYANLSDKDLEDLTAYLLTIK